MPAPHGSALVTGSSGFFGGHLVSRLVRDGVDVSGLDFVAPRTPRPSEMRDLRVDIRDAEAVRHAVLKTRPEVVYHLAAQASVSVSMREPEVDIETNVLGSVHLMRAAIEAGTRRFVFVSTGGALFGEPPVVPVTEETPTAPESIYGASKLAAEQYLRLLAGPAGVELSVVRPGNIYGPAQDPHGEAGVVAIFALRMLANEPVTIFGDGSQRRDYVYVDDVVEAAVCAATDTPATCLIGTGIGTSTRTVYEQLARLAGYERAAEHGPERPGDIQRIMLDASHARAAWGWEPQTDLETGLAATVRWFRETSG
jgi:UDP-glucose 4-epimerase